jgi:hypothetical protein
MSKIRKGLQKSRRDFLYSVTGTAAVAAASGATVNAQQDEQPASGDHSQPGSGDSFQGRVDLRGVERCTAAGDAREGQVGTNTAYSPLAAEVNISRFENRAAWLSVVKVGLTKILE